MNNEGLGAADTEEAESAQEKVTLRLPSQALTTVKKRAARKGVSVNEFTRQALGTEVYLMDQVAAGSRVLIERPDKSLMELVLR